MKDLSGNMVCRNCGRPIEPSVLQRNPYASYCAACAVGCFDGPDIIDDIGYES